MQSAGCVRWALSAGLLVTLGCTSEPSPNEGGAGTTTTGGSSSGAGGGNASAGTSTTTGGNATAGSAAGGGASGGNAAAGTASGGSAGASGGSASGGTAGNANAGAGGGLACAGRIVCDDFESGAMAGAKPGKPWKLLESKGTVTLDDTRAVSGKYSVKLAVTATADKDTYRRAFLSLDGAPLLPLANNKVYGRFMIYTDRIPDKSVHWTIAHGDGPYAASGTTATYNYGGMGNLMANYYRNTMPDPTDCWQTKNESFPTGKWQCVGFYFDGPNNEMRFWMGQNEVSELHVLGNQKSDATCTVKGVDGKWYAPNFKNISLGWESYQHDVAGAHDAWIDDVVLDDEPIACP